MKFKKAAGSSGGLKGLFAKHIEKMLLMLVGLMALLLVWSGFKNRQGISGKDPDSLRQKITQTTGHIDGFDWESEDFQKQRDLDQGFVKQASDALKAMDVASYKMNQIIRPPLSPPRTKRKDPERFAAESLQARASYGLIAERRDFAERTGPPVVDLPSITEEDDEVEERRIPNSGSRRRSNLRDAKGVYFVAVTGLIPFRKQLAEYQGKLLQARNHSPERDTPTYVNWVLQRADVIPGVEPTYRPVALYRILADGQNEFRGGGMSRNELEIHPKFEDATLTRPWPEIQTRHVNEIAVHDRIRELSLEELAKEQAPAVNVVGAEVQGADADIFGRSRENDEGFARGGGSRRGRMPRDGPPRGRPPQEFMGEGEGRMPGNMSRQSGSRPDILGDTPLEEAPEFKMFRYVDTKVVPGNSYQYRLQLFVEDPNDPNDDPAPPSNSLEGEVQVRIKKLVSETKRPNTPYYGLPTPASQPSNVAFVSDGRRLLAGMATLPRPMSLRGQNRVFFKPGDEPTAMAMALQFDPSIPGEIPGEVKVRRGSVAKFVKDVEVPYPKEGVLRWHRPQEFDVPALVLDIRGGEPASDDVLKAPAELLVWNDQGKMELLDEIEDAEEYESFIFEPDETTRTRNEDGPPGRDEMRGFGEESSGRRRGRRNSGRGER